MKQARVLNAMEMKRLLAVVEAGKHPQRNRIAVMLSYLAGLRVGEIAQLMVSDVYQNDNTVRDQIFLPAGYTKTNDARSVETRIFLVAMRWPHIKKRPTPCEAGLV